ncbi:MAG: hypothetical protein WCW27_04040 [Patescibacteria group bacterium]|jgi:hypothetical protein
MDNILDGLSPTIKKNLLGHAKKYHEAGASLSAGGRDGAEDHRNMLKNIAAEAIKYLSEVCRDISAEQCQTLWGAARTQYSAEQQEASERRITQTDETSSVFVRESLRKNK